MSDHSLPDEQLMQRIRQQDQVALSILYQRYSTQVYSLAYRVVQNAHLAEEVTQDTFMKVWKQASGWDASKGRFSSWLLTVARYTAIDRLRLEQRQSSLDTAPLDGIQPPETKIGIPHDPLLQDSHLLRELLQQLPQEQTQAIELAFFEGLTHQELAARLNLPLGTVKTRVRLGLQKLKHLWHEATGTQESP